jgi:uncharacterized membrane protein
MDSALTTEGTTSLSLALPSGSSLASVVATELSSEMLLLLTIGLLDRLTPETLKEQLPVEDATGSPAV